MKDMPLLSQRERQVVREIVAGHTYAAAAENLGLSVDSVKTYAKRLRKKLGLHSKVQVAVWAMNEDESNGRVHATKQSGRVAGVRPKGRRRRTAGSRG